jgi:hypothetical protein
MKLLVLTPRLIGKDSASSKPQTRDTINPEMSPAEALYVTANLVRQKLLNPDFQKTPEERRADWIEMHKPEHTRALADIAASSSRIGEMENVIRTAMQKMSLRDLQDQTSKTLDLLGMEQ